MHVPCLYTCELIHVLTTAAKHYLHGSPLSTNHTLRYLKGTGLSERIAPLIWSHKLPIPRRPWWNKDQRPEDIKATYCTVLGRTVQLHWRTTPGKYTYQKIIEGGGRTSTAASAHWQNTTNGQNEEERTVWWIQGWTSRKYFSPSFDLSQQSQRCDWLRIWLKSTLRLTYVFSRPPAQLNYQLEQGIFSLYNCVFALGLQPGSYGPVI